jgi:hypothetical protein
LEWEPNERDAWVTDAERWIAQIHGVRQCKIDLDPDGVVTGVHVVAGMEREPRHIVRDVEGLLKARLGIAVFYKKIGVVQVVENEADEELATTPSQEEPVETVTPVEPNSRGTTPKAVVLEEVLAPRIQCNGVVVMASDRSVRAEVELQAGAVESRGVAEGANHPGSDLQLIGRATIAAVLELLGETVILDLSEVRTTEMASETIVMAAVELVEGRRSERLFGASPTAHNRHQAVVYAILDALNRRLALMVFKTGEVEL